MKLEKKILRGAVIEGYTVLMRAEAELLLTPEKSQIEQFYLSLSEKCMTWATEVRGEKLREDFLSLENVTEKAHFQARRYQLRMQCPWEDPPYTAIVCESILKGDDDSSRAYRRVSHVWNVEEECMLPPEQIVRMFCAGSQLKTVKFHPDGIYPENEMLVFFKNPGKNNDFLEVRRKIGKNGKK